MKEEARPAATSAWRRWGAALGRALGKVGRAAMRAVTSPARWVAGSARRRWAAAVVMLMAAAGAAVWVLAPEGALSRGAGWQPPVLRRMTGDEGPQGAVPLAARAEGTESRAARTAAPGAEPASRAGRGEEEPRPEPAQAHAGAPSGAGSSSGSPRGDGAAAATARSATPADRPLVLASPAAEAVVAQGRGWYRHPVYRDWRFHPGVELQVAAGSDVVAALPGVVIAAGPDERWGLAVRLQHSGGWQTVYGYLQAVVVEEGQQVAAGAPVGIAGFSPWGEPRLFFAVWKDGMSVDPLPLLAR